MNSWVRSYYRRLRAKGWTAKAALHAARVQDEFEDLQNDGLVRLDVIPDDSALSWDDLCGDSFDFKANPDIQRSRLEREREAFERKVNQDGVWGIVSKYLTKDGEWELADSCWGFVGNEWRDSGYDTDIMSAAISEAKKVAEY